MIRIGNFPTQNIHPSWEEILYKTLSFGAVEFNQQLETIDEVSICPRKENVLRVFENDLDKVKVIILGQDPYPNIQDATGLAFENGNNKKPYSLKTIYQEILNDYPDTEPDIHHWAEQGVLLLNTALTVEVGKAGSHLHLWRPFTIELIKRLSNYKGYIWLLMGRNAAEYGRYIRPFVHISEESLSNLNQISDNNTNYIVATPHPAAEAYTGNKAGFLGSHAFYYINEILRVKNQQQIKW